MTEEFLKRILATSSEEEQIDLLIEEMSELTKALLKEKRVRKYYSRFSDNERTNPLRRYDIESYIHRICEEMADVHLMLEQMTVIYPKELVEKYKAEKIKRVENILADKEKLLR